MTPKPDRTPSAAINRVMAEYRLTVVFEAEGNDEAHEQMDEAMQAFYSIVSVRREESDGRTI